jgi:hypothetical protein
MPSKRLGAARGQFTIGHFMIVTAVFVVLFAIVPAGIAAVVFAALIIPLLSDLASRPKPRIAIQSPPRPTAPGQRVNPGSPG